MAFQREISKTLRHLQATTIIFGVFFFLINFLLNIIFSVCTELSFNTITFQSGFVQFIV